jgi:hypothetical protein
MSVESDENILSRQSPRLAEESHNRRLSQRGPNAKRGLEVDFENPYGRNTTGHTDDVKVLSTTR